MTRPPKYRGNRLDGAPLDYAPENELGVVYLFSHLAQRKLGLRVDRIRSGFPDCIAYRDGRRIRIEFEFRSRNFAQHRHNRRACDWIVCWIHDWPSCPPSLRVVELRKYYGQGFNVWVVPTSGKYREIISRVRRHGDWSTPSQATEGDLILFYRTHPDAFIKDIFRVAGPVLLEKAGWRPGNDWGAPIQRVASLGTPLHLRELRSNPVLKSAGFVRGKFRGRYKVTAHWPELFDMILQRNPGLRPRLSLYGPARLA